MSEIFTEIKNGRSKKEMVFLIALAVFCLSRSVGQILDTSNVSESTLFIAVVITIIIVITLGIVAFRATGDKQNVYINLADKTFTTKTNGTMLPATNIVGFKGDVVGRGTHLALLQTMYVDFITRDGEHIKMNDDDVSRNNNGDELKKFRAFINATSLHGDEKILALAFVDRCELKKTNHET